MNKGLFKRATPEERARRGQAEALQRLVTATGDQRLDALAGLIRALRPRRAEDTTTALNRVQGLNLLLKQDASGRAALREALLQLLAEKQWVHLLADSGVIGSQGLFGGLWRRLGHKLLPDVVRKDNLRDVLGLLFSRADDYVWVRAVETPAWVALLDALELNATPAPDLQRRILLQVLEALQVLAYRLASIGLEPELVRNDAAIERYESPFLAQAEEVRQFIRDRHQALAEKRAPAVDDKHLLVLLGQCREVAVRIRKQAEKTGASIGLTTLLLRSEQIGERMRALLRLLEPRPAHELNADRVALFKVLVRSENLRYSLSEYWAQHTALLASRITSNAGRAAEPYITATRAEYVALFRSALGAGLLVALAAFFKLGLSAEPHAPFVEAVLYSANYAWCFVLMSALHWTLATKQPAMTANRIAHTMDADAPGRAALEGLAELIVRTLRSQFVAVVGNLATAATLALGLSYAIAAQTGAPAMAPEVARQTLADTDPLGWHTWVWAALTGLWLFAAGLISGYYDNKAVYDRIPARVAQLRWLRALAGDDGAAGVARYVEYNLGALTGSLFFGIFLGSTAAVGKILGLPLDTLHVTFASANAVFALVALDWQVPATLYLRVGAGIALIGMLNLTVSFGLALWVAMRSRGVEFAQTGPLLRRLARRAREQPLAYLFPPREPLPAPEKR
jgi:site-specific recombinase